ncbi:hypothetical protein CLAFUW4_20087 [Fulvia fulva]|uniref:uncharacterized protein n=1 Tax=Passalora fulva TaxID=5499 RepID=UPI002852AF65|nr:uncharacterized protein CLAFUR5_20087 [Fulvia fulva]KAK4615423.1 hypothetical protein CLAFUR4_20087 [Fulvia fulva]KAK4616917.1 hypothetical protein CLAFUR0_20087 [Fulvia fulva]WMI39029.1 hypothetical protein CLAFUR5_20087 [Fulvia fulva]WPV18762.1 hypothetical protein CLAFUW4_20087 [Fulvia fulva]WPV34392.1 hypothetical protein CLAFUW7_20087 [Fulvia fulva]
MHVYQILVFSAAVATCRAAVMPAAVARDISPASAKAVHQGEKRGYATWTDYIPEMDGPHKVKQGRKEERSSA